MSEDRTGLRNLILATTPEPWQTSGGGVRGTGPLERLIALIQSGTPQQANIAYIASFSPAVTQGLLDEIERLEQENLVTQDLLSKAEQERDEAIARAQKAKTSWP